MHNPNIKIYQYLIIYIILFFYLHQNDLLIEFSREWYFSYLINSCRYRTAISIDVLWMLVPDENLTKWTLLVQRSPQALIDHHIMLFTPYFIYQTKHSRERERERDSRYDYESTKYYQAFFFTKVKQNISSLHKIISSVLSLFLLYIMKVVAACKVSSVFNHISPSFL